MKTKQAKSPQGQVFSHPIRKLNADELEKVVGEYFHNKCYGGTDNQGREH